MYRSPPVISEHSVTFVVLHAYPDPAVGAKRVSELANYLANRGWRVSVICSEGPFPTAGGTLKTSILRSGIPIPRTIYSYCRPLVPTALRRSESDVAGQSRAAGPTPADSTVRRRGLIDTLRHAFLDVTLLVDRYKLWSCKAFLRAWISSRTRQSDVLVCSGPPWSTVVAGVLAARLRRIPLLLDFRDPWWDDQFPSSAFSTRIIRRLERWCVHQSSAITCTSNGIADALKARYPSLSVPIEVVRNGFDRDDELHDDPPTTELRILFAGTIYLNRSPMPLLEGVRLLIQESGVSSDQVHVTLVGACEEWNGISLAKWARGNGLERNVSVRPSVSQSEVRQLTAQSNVLANFCQGQKKMIPAKLFEQIAARRRILLFAEPDSEAAACSSHLSLVTRLDDDAVAVRDALIRIHREVTQQDACGRDSDAEIHKYSRAHSNQNMERILSNIASRQPTSG